MDEGEKDALLLPTALGDALSVGTPEGVVGGLDARPLGESELATVAALDAEGVVQLEEEGELGRDGATLTVLVADKLTEAVRAEQLAAEEAPAALV